MIDSKAIRLLTSRYQTTVDNVMREYFQHLFLSTLYQQRRSELLLFKGGTALRMIYRSPRFSEDLDFTGTGMAIREIESVVEGALTQIEYEGIRVGIEEAKKTSGGYFGIITFQGGEYRSEIQFEVSLRKGREGKGTVSLISSDFAPPYTILQLEEKSVGQRKSECRPDPLKTAGFL